MVSDVRISLIRMVKKKGEFTIVKHIWRAMLNARTLDNKRTLTATASREFECPYEYILQAYGRNHFSNIIDILDPQLESRDPNLFELILEILDAIHFGAILVDDVADNSLLRKGKLAAHHIYGSSETVNRAYLRILEVMEKCRQQQPLLIPFVMENLTQIHQGYRCFPFQKV